jgi:hypothetical protein
MLSSWTRQKLAIPLLQNSKGMRWATLDRKMNRTLAAEAVCKGHPLPFVQSLSRR